MDGNYNFDFWILILIPEMHMQCQKAHSFPNVLILTDFPVKFKHGTAQVAI